MSAPGLIIAAPASGSGKTLVTLALLRALGAAGIAVTSFKVGPDYIDPMFHARASGRRCVNLDSWAMRIETLAGLSDDLGRDAELVIGEGVMGLFDGAADGRGSTADLASLFDLPVILVVDARGMAASVAALVEGFTRHRDDVEVAGVIFNRVGSEAHATILRRACDDRFAQPVLGCLPGDARLELPERHLGWCRPMSCRSSTNFSRPRRRSSRSASIWTGCAGLPARSGSVCMAPRHDPWGRSASGSPWRRIRPLRSPIPPCWMVGGQPAPNSFLLPAGG